MKARSIVAVSLLAVILLFACAPAGTSTPAPPELPTQLPPQETEPPIPAASSPTESQSELSQTEVAPTEAPKESPQALATSRGPDLEATDPATVSLASGELQLVEFFRFT